MWKASSVATGMVAALLATGAGSSGLAQTPQKLRVQASFPGSSVVMDGFKLWSDRVKSMSAGRLEIEGLPAGVDLPRPAGSPSISSRPPDMVLTRSDQSFNPSMMTLDAGKLDWTRSFCGVCARAELAPVANRRPLYRWPQKMPSTCLVPPGLCLTAVIRVQRYT